MGSSVSKWHHHHILFFLLLFWLDVISAVDSDKSVLLEFKNSVSDPSGLLSDWNVNSSHCSWFGVSCNSSSRVMSLNITGDGWKGNSKPYTCSILVQFPLYGFGIRRNCMGSNGKLVGMLSPVIAKLTELRIISLPYNELNGEIPGEFWGMEKLEVFDLEGNSVSGTLPIRFDGFRKLRVLNLGFNRISGMIPTSLSTCVGLEVLNLAGNQLSGAIPGFVGSLNELRGLYLSFNRLLGSIPIEFWDKCEKLEHLDLSGNFLVGVIPSSLGNCSRLRTLSLYANMFEEDIPAELGRLQMLEVLDVSRNSLSGSLPRQLGNCSALSVLVLSNMFNLLPSINTLGDALRWRSVINEDYNYFQGTIPVEITTLPKLQMLWAPRATLEGSFPDNWGACSSLQMISLAQNFFTGEIPKGFLLCQKLHYLDLSSNKLTGELVEKLPVPCMTLFDVAGNILSGPIPRFNDITCPQIPSFNAYSYELDNPSSAYLWVFTYKTQVESLFPLFGGSDDLVVYHNFGGNSFTGTFRSMPIASERLGKQTVYAFSAGENALTGPFPGKLFEKCDGLSAMIVNVSNNRISYQIPEDIGTMCRSLKLLEASGNQINGSLPHSIGDLVSLVALNLSGNWLQGQIPASLFQIKGLKYLSLAGNNLTGFIPSSLGQLDSLEVLELSSNSFYGEIPKELVSLSNLTVLLLNNNNLSGKIPSGLGNATSLSSFNASFNNLSGPLPLNGNILNCSSVVGNPFLKSCRVSRSLPSSNQPWKFTQNYYPPLRNATQVSRKNGLNSIEIASIASASAIVSVLLALIVLFFYTKRWNPGSRVARSARKEVRMFTDIGVALTFENIVRSTGGFNASNCIGNGGFGATYRAEISSGVIVAIKRLAVGRFQGIQQFHAEVKTLGRLRHPNLVTLIGYHVSETEMFLIYNYLPGGNLETFIQERSTRTVDWKIIHKIALDVASALAYLHEHCVPRVLHRDVKPSNILLDNQFTAYLSDFGLARLLGTSETHATTGVAGTFGYVAPEYAMTCRVSDKADVYSYGVVLLELISDKKALDPSFSSFGNGFNIVAWGCMLLREGRAKEFFTAGLWDAGPHDDLVEVLHLAVVCTIESLSRRPTMRQVVLRLKQLQPPS